MCSNSGSSVVRRFERVRRMFHADRIIVAFDGSENSKKALQTAIDLAKTVNAAITVAHSHDMKDNQTVIDPPRPAAEASYISGGMTSVPDPLISDVTSPEPMIYEDRTEEVIAEARMMLNEQQADGDIDILEGRSGCINYRACKPHFCRYDRNRKQRPKQAEKANIRKCK